MPKFMAAGYKLILIVVYAALLIVYSPAAGYAYNHKVGHWNLNTEYTGGYSVGHNITKGVIKTLVQYMDSRHDLYVVLPDDGCTWVVNSVFLGVAGADDDYFVQTTNFTVTTAGLFEGPSVLDAVAAANEAKTSAGQAKTAADAARDRAAESRDYAAEARNEIRFGSYNGGKSLGAAYDRAAEAAARTTDGGYSAAQWANWGRSEAINARDRATESRDRATEARNEIVWGSYTGTGKSLGAAYDRANEASSRTWDAGTGKSAATLARESRDYASAASAQAAAAAVNAANSYSAVHGANGNTITAVRDAGGTVLAEARQSKINALNAYNQAVSIDSKVSALDTAAGNISSRIDSLQTSVTNIQNNIGADTSPPVVRLRTVSGALATSGGSIRAVLEISDNVSSTFTYSLDGISFQAMPADMIITLPVTDPGVNVIVVRVKDEAGNTGAASIIIRRL
jgi:hypothetical protein